MWGSFGYCKLHSLTRCVRISSTFLFSGKAPARFFTNVTDGLIATADSSSPNSICSPSPTSSFSSSTTPFKMELILPRCCEDGIETAWIQTLLASTRSLHVIVHYKCPACLPKSKAKEWLQTKVESNSALSRHYPNGVSLLDDSTWLPYELTGRLRQVTSFDTVYNGKEVTAYLNHIVDNYDNLADQTVFLHSVPNAHIYFKLFFRLINYAEVCHTTVPFLHLNANYKSDAWGDCCGRNRACQQSTWQYLFGNDIPSQVLARTKSEQFRYPNNGAIGTYSSAQFAASRDAIRQWPKSFWTKMLLAINGTHDLAGCPTNSEPGKNWGGHQLTGQYERFWHIIFGHSYMQVSRQFDNSLPEYLRRDCGPKSCVGAV